MRETVRDKERVREKEQGRERQRQREMERDTQRERQTETVRQGEVLKKILLGVIFFIVQLSVSFCSNPCKNGRLKSRKIANSIVLKKIP